MPPEKEAGTNTSVVERTPEVIAAEEAEGEKAFAAGVTKVTGVEAPVVEEKKPVDDTKTAEEKKVAEDAAAKATADAAQKERLAQEEATRVAAEKEWEGVSPGVRKRIEALSNVPAQIDKLAGHIGGFKQQIAKITEIATTATAAAAKKGEAAPTKLEIQEAMLDPVKWKEMQEAYGEWMAPVAAELARVRKDMAAIVARGDGQSEEAKALAEALKTANKPAETIDTDAIVAEAEERAFVRMKHPDWKAICASPEFAKDWLPKQSKELQDKAASDSAEDAIAVFDAFKSHKQQIADAESARLQKEKRLQSAVPAKGTTGAPDAGLSDDEAFNAGVKKVVKAK